MREGCILANDFLLLLGEQGVLVAIEEESVERDAQPVFMGRHDAVNIDVWNSTRFLELWSKFSQSIYYQASHLIPCIHGDSQSSFIGTRFGTYRRDLLFTGKRTTIKTSACFQMRNFCF